MRGVVDPHALHVRRGAPRDRRVHGARIESRDRDGRAHVQVWIVHGVLGDHRREHEKLARAGDWPNTNPEGTSVNQRERK